MCGRYTLYDTTELPKRYQLVEQPLIHVDNNYNVAPGQFMPVVINGASGHELVLMKWGFIPHWSKDIKIGYKLINARAESVFEKPMWRNSAQHYRCLVPARGFYEWKKLNDGKTKQPFYIHPKNIEIFSFAGLWSIWKDVEGREIRSFTILTTEPNKEMSTVHDRMPVILHPDEEDAWLDDTLTEPAEIEQFLRPLHDGGLEMYKVSTDVNITKNNENTLIYPLNSK